MKNTKDIFFNIKYNELLSTDISSLKNISFSKVYDYYNCDILLNDLKWCFVKNSIFSYTIILEYKLGGDYAYMSRIFYKKKVFFYNKNFFKIKPFLKKCINRKKELNEEFQYKLYPKKLVEELNLIKRSEKIKRVKNNIKKK